MAPRVELQTLLESLTSYVYFQPPVNLQIQYPCIIYKRDNSQVEYADNKQYAHMKRYQIIVIDRSPDSELSDKVEALLFCSFDRAYASENLNHYVFNLFF